MNLLFDTHSFSVPATARWIGSAHPFDLHEVYLDFRSPVDFFLAEAPQSAQLFITGDSRYKAWVNGVFVGRGPARSWPHAQKVDAYDVTAHLSAGHNAIAGDFLLVQPELSRVMGDKDVYLFEAALVQQQFHALARGHFAFGVLGRDAIRAAPLPRRSLAFAQFQDSWVRIVVAQMIHLKCKDLNHKVTKTQRKKEKWIFLCAFVVC